MDKVTCPIADWSTRDAEGPIVVSDAGEMSFGKFHALVDNICTQLARKNISERSRVAILSDTSPEFVTLLFSLWRLGAVACPISPKIPSTQVKEMIALAGCSHLWDPADKLPLPGPKSIERIKIEPDDSNPESGSNAEWQLQRPATIVFTSGSSGYPKAAVHSLGNHYYNAIGSNENIRLEPGDRWLLSLPLYHVGGLAILFRTAIAGASIVLPAPNTEMADAIANHLVTHLSMVSTQLYRLLSQQEAMMKMKNVKAILMGGSAIPRPLAEEGWKRGLPLYLSYGMTEMCSQVATTAGEHEYSSGKPLKHRDMRIADDGEILVRGETLFNGYIQDGEITTAVDNDGWFHTGDIGYFDDTGNLFVVGRKDNMFISGGENIHPEEIEAALMEIEDVAEAVVVPVKNPEFGYRPVAFVRTDPPREITAADLPGLPSFKIPIKFYDWPRKYETGGIKLDRRQFHKLVKDMYEHF